MNDVGFLSGAIAPVFGNVKPDDKLAGGIAASYAVMGYRGKVWSVKYRGEETKLMRLDMNGNEDGPANSIEVVILDANDHLSKNFFLEGWVEGSTAPPDCFSNNGVTPDPASPKLQSPTCATCPRNVWGSTVSKVTGKPAKECQDNKRLAVVPLGNIKNEVYGGPMLLRVPAASLQEVVAYSQKMKQLGFPFYAIGTKISFDVNANYPKFVFSGIRVLTQEEAIEVIAHREGPQVARVLAEAAQEVTPTGNGDARQQALNEAFEQPPQVAAKPEGIGWGQNKPSTGAVSSTPAQPVEQSSQKTPQHNTAPASAPPHPTTLREQLVASLAGGSPSPAGGAGTADGGPAQTNGATSHTTQKDATTPSQSDTGTPTQTASGGTTTPTEEVSTVGDFETGLDELMDNLLK